MAKNELEAAGIQFATTIVILTQALSTKDGMMNSRRRDNQYLMDAESIMIGSKVRSLCGSIRTSPHILLELMHTGNLSLVDDLVSYGDSEFQSSLYAAGGVTFTSIHDALVCQAFYNPSILSVLSAMLGTMHAHAEVCDQRSSDPAVIRKARGRSGSVDYGNGVTGNSVMMSSGSGLDLRSLIGEQQRSLEVQQANFSKVEHQLQQLEVPEEYVGARYGDLLSCLAQQQHIALGLYRMPGTSGSPHGYVATNPPAQTELTRGDRMFVLSCHDLFDKGFLSNSNSTNDLPTGR